EQGLGDTLQFVRYVPLVAERGGSVVLELPSELRSVLSNVAGAVEIITRGEALPEFAWHCPLLSLPLAFNTDLASIPANIPYLKADPDATRTWSQPQQRDALRVGLARALAEEGFQATTYDPLTAFSARPQGRFDLITCFQVMEHLPFPD